jgi:hypothetical protein
MNKREILSRAREMCPDFVLKDIEAVLGSGWERISAQEERRILLEKRLEQRRIDSIRAYRPPVASASKPVTQRSTEWVKTVEDELMYKKSVHHYERIAYGRAYIVYVNKGYNISKVINNLRDMYKEVEFMGAVYD